MATGGPPFLQPGRPVTSSIDCPLCGCLCLGPVILPCTDVICRKCLHYVLRAWGLRSACQQCGQHLDFTRDRAVTVSELVRQLGVDPVIDSLVHRELNKATDVRCLHCPHDLAVNVCLDCQDYYCDVCSANHLRSRASRDHVLHLLSQAQRDAPFVACAAAPPRQGSSSDGIQDLPDPQSDVVGSRDGDEWNEWVNKQMGLLREASRQKAEVKDVLLDIMSLGQQLLERVQIDEQLPEPEQPRFDVIPRAGPGS